MNLWKYLPDQTNFKLFASFGVLRQLYELLQNLCNWFVTLSLVEIKVYLILIDNLLILLCHFLIQ